MKIKLQTAIKVNRGLWIPQFILQDKNLTLREKLVYSLIVNFDRKDSFFMGNNNMAKHFAMSRHNIQKVLDQLSKKKYIKRKIIHKQDGSYLRRIITVINRDVEIKGKSLDEYLDEERNEQAEFQISFFE